MKGVEADRFFDVHVSPDGKRTRVIFEQDGNQFYLECDIGALRALMPTLVAVTNPTGPEVTAITVVGVRADLDRSGDFLLTLTNSRGGQTVYEFDRDLLVKLSALVGEALRAQSGSSEIH